MTRLPRSSAESPQPRSRVRSHWPVPEWPPSSFSNGAAAVLRERPEQLAEKYLKGNTATEGLGPVGVVLYPEAGNSPSTRNFVPPLPDVFRRRVAIPGEFLLMPVGVWLRKRADIVETFHLAVREAPGRGGEVVAKLLLVARADDHGVHARFAHHPVQRGLGNGTPALRGNFGQGVDNSVEPLLIDRAGRVQTVQPRL